LNKNQLASVALTLFLVFLLVTVPVSASQGSAQNVINQVKSNMKECYDALLQAEKAGADINNLTVTLNSAALRLSNAELAYQSGDYDKAYGLANQAQSKLDGFQAHADSLKQATLASSRFNEFFSVMLLAIGTLLFGLGIAVWLILGKRERRNQNGAVPV
jgi:hypothetical protein